MHNVILPVADGFEEIEAVSVIDILRRAKIGVRISSIGEREVVSAEGLKIIADSQFIDEVVQDYDAIILPGGTEGANRLHAFTPLVTALLNFNKDNSLIAAICASPALVLSPIGLLDNKKATCYPSFKDRIKHYVDSDVVQDDNIITSQGPGTAFSFALKIVEHFLGEKTVLDLKTGMLLK